LQPALKSLPKSSQFLFRSSAGPVSTVQATAFELKISRKKASLFWILSFAASPCVVWTLTEEHPSCR
ncbi:hypothetical protein LEMLEM_LOCUS9423, partial [Lemmus lemmus]